ncbi:hypothetical protein [Pseudomonas sp. Z3-8]|uniref:hypothetical protein n=1 Tax=unclassified Pseudomonas TaxID=196821 RepID=UPI003DA844CC
MKKRDLFAEMMQGVEEMAAHREGKITLRQIKRPGGFVDQAGREVSGHGRTAWRCLKS